MDNPPFYCGWIGGFLFFVVNLLLLALITMILRNEIRGAGFVKPIWKQWYITGIVLLVCSFFIGYLPFTCKESNRYLLSTIAQSIAALFGILFIISIALPQLKKGSGIIFNNNVFIYILCLLSCIILSFIAFTNVNSQMLIKIVLNLAVVDILMLLPFIWRFKVRGEV